jgi:hypothetical protein
MKKNRNILFSFPRLTTLYDKVCQWLVTGRWFSPGTRNVLSHVVKKYVVSCSLKDGRLNMYTSCLKTKTIETFFIVFNVRNFMILMFNTTFNNIISVILWWAVLLVEEIGVMLHNLNNIGKSVNSLSGRGKVYSIQHCVI